MTFLDERFFGTQCSYGLRSRGHQSILPQLKMVWYRNVFISCRLFNFMYAYSSILSTVAHMLM